jgi:cytochrome c oxidase assembly protein subunit 15
MTGVHRLIEWVRSPVTLRRAALASLAANVALVITGGAVRLTDSGLGCPTWPQCTDGSYTTTPAMGIHGVIEYGNRTLTGVLVAIAVFGALSALLQRPRRRRVTVLSLVVLATIPAQAVLGGITVLTHLNPWVVASHFLLSIVIIAITYAFWIATGESDAPAGPTVPHPLRLLVAATAAAAAAVIMAGTVVTGSGPHAGDAHARRTGLDPATVAQLHADLVFLLIGLSVGTWFALRAVGARGPAVRAAWLIAIIASQAVIGFVQYATNLPPLIVGAHMAGACAVWLGTLALVYSTRTRPDRGQPRTKAKRKGDLRVMVDEDWVPLLEDSRQNG